MSDRPQPKQPQPSTSEPAEEHREQEAKMRSYPLRDRLLQLFSWLYPYTARRERRRDDERE